MRLLPSTAADHSFSKAEIFVLWLVVATAVGMIFWPRLDQSFNSTDNAMRLVEIRSLLAGAAWFDPHEPRFAPPVGYDTHWSRLIDAGVAALILGFRLVVAPELAERLARAIWPLLLSGPAVFAVTAIAVRLAGPGAARAALVAALPTLALLPVFHPGEIDHHNAQITLALVLVACALWCERRFAASAAGLVGGVLLGVGLEAVHVLLCVAGVLAILLVMSASWRRPARRFALALAASTGFGFFVLTPAAFRWSPQCDALAVNSAASVTTGAVAMAILATFAGALSAPRRGLLLVVGAGAAAAVYLGLEPRCLQGPFGLIDGSIFPLWLDRVQEMQPLAALFRAEGARAMVYVGFPLIAALSVLVVVRRGLPTPMAWALVASFALSGALMFGQVRMIVYVIWLGLPFLGAAAQFLAERTGHVALVRLLVAALASPPFVSVAAAELTAGAEPPRSNTDADQAIMACFQPHQLRTLAALPSGLVLAPLDLGPAILAHTRHSVVAAPYHRADRAIRFNQEVMDGQNSAAQPRVVASGVDYVVTCTGYAGHLKPGSFHDALLAGNIGAWLEPLASSDDERVKIWRVVR
jgi:hypothetical protein